MKTIDRIKKKGYAITYNMGYRDGEQCIVSISAVKPHRTVTARNITTLFKLL